MSHSREPNAMIGSRALSVSGLMVAMRSVGNIQREVRHVKQSVRAWIPTDKANSS